MTKPLIVTDPRISPGACATDIATDRSNAWLASKHAKAIQWNFWGKIIHWYFVGNSQYFLVGDIWDALCVQDIMAWCKLCRVWLNSIHKKTNLDDGFAANCIWDCNYSDVIMGAMASQITNLAIVYSTVYSGADQRKHQSFRVTGLCVGNSPVTGEFPAQMASNAENVSIWWRHHIMLTHTPPLMICHVMQGCERGWVHGLVVIMVIEISTSTHIEVRTKWLPLCRQIFKIHFLEWIVFVFWHRFYWSLLPRVQFRVYKYWFR